MKSKYDRPKLKLEFFESEFDEVEGFFRDKFKTKTDWSIRKNTKWRTKRKQDMKHKAVEKALQKNINKRANKLEIPVEALREAKVKALWKIMEMLDTKNLSMKDMAVWLEKIKTELWEPERIGANYNLNANKVEWLSEEEAEALDTLFGKTTKKTKVK